MLTFVFFEDRKTNGYKTNYIVIDSFDMPVDFYEFVKNEYGVNKKNCQFNSYQNSIRK